MTHLASSLVEDDFDVENRSELLQSKRDGQGTVTIANEFQLTPNIARKSGSLNLKGMLDT